MSRTRLDPRTSILAIVLLILATLTGTHPLSFLGLGLLFLFVFVRTQTPWRIYLRNLALLSWFLLFTFFAYAWGDGTTGSGQNALDGLYAIGQLSLVVGWVTILANYLSPLVLVNGLERLLQPLRMFSLPVAKMSIVTMLSLRFIPILVEESQQLHQTYLARGIEIHAGNVRTRLRNYVLLCGPLLNSLFRRVEHLALAMESRAFHVETERTSSYVFRMTRVDYLLLAGTILLLLVIFFHG